MKTDASMVQALLAENERLKIRLGRALIVRDTADALLRWRDSDGDRIVDIRMQDYIDACKALEECEL